MKKEYALYKGEEILAMGTIFEIGTRDGCNCRNNKILWM